MTQQAVARRGRKDTAGGTRAAPGDAALPRMPGLARVGGSRAVVELKGFFRNRQSLVFTFSLPVLLLLLFGTIFKGTVGTTGVPLKQVFTAGIVASGVMSVSFSSLAISIAIERDDGTLRRLAATPMPKAAYFVGKLAMVLVGGVCEVAVLLGVGVAFFGLSLPDSPTRWATLVWVFVLGIVSCSLLGIAYSRLAPNGKSAPAVVQPPYLALQFISGVYFLYSDLPKVLQTVAAFFPLKWMAQGLRSALLPDRFATTEVTHHWERGHVALVLGVWCVVGFALSAATFRWRTRRDG